MLTGIRLHTDEIKGRPDQSGMRLVKREVNQYGYGAKQRLGRDRIKGKAS